MLISVFIVFATAMFGFLGVIWSTKSWLNSFIKVSLFGMTFYGFYIMIVTKLFGG